MFTTTIYIKYFTVRLNIIFKNKYEMFSVFGSYTSTNLKSYLIFILLINALWIFVVFFLCQFKEMTLGITHLYYSCITVIYILFQKKVFIGVKIYEKFCVNRCFTLNLVNVIIALFKKNAREVYLVK